MDIKKISQKDVSSTWDEGYQQIKECGVTNLVTFGSDEWNQEVASKLSDRLQMKVIYVGLTPGYNKVKGIHRFMVQARTNKEAKGLLSKEYD